MSASARSAKSHFAVSDILLSTPNCGLRVTGTPVPRNGLRLYVCLYKPGRVADVVSVLLACKVSRQCVEVEGGMIITKEGAKTQKLSTHSLKW